MTSITVNISGATTIADIKRVERAWRSLADTVYAARGNLICRQRIGATELPLLDADFVYGGLTKFATTMAVRGGLGNDRSHRLTSDLSERLGPASIRAFLSRLTTYMIPVGSWVEVERARESMSESGSVFATRLQSFFQAAEAGRPLREVIRSLPGDNIGEYVSSNLQNFVTSFHEEEMLDRLLRGSANAIEFLGEKTLAEATETRRLVFQSLQSTRWNRANANLCDALNAEILVQAFNTQYHQRVAPILPVLISGTGAVHQCEELIARKLRLPDSVRSYERPRVVGSHAYLYISHAVEERAGANNLELARDILEMLQKSLDTISQHCRRLVSNSKAPFAGDDTVVVDQFEWERLQELTDEFNGEWGALFHPYTQMRKHDHVALLNSLVSPDLLQELRAGPQRDKVDSALQRLSSRLKQQISPGGRDFFTIIQHYATLRRAPVDLSSKPRLFTFSVSDVDGELLTKKYSGESIFLTPTATRPEWVNGVHEKRIYVHVAHIQRPAIMAFDSWRVSLGGEQWVRITWLHASDIQAICHQALAYFDGLRGAFGSAQLRLAWRIYTLTEIRQGNDSDIEAVRSAVTTAFDATFIEISCCECIFFADITPLEGQELQVGLMLTASGWSKREIHGKILPELLRKLNTDDFDSIHWKHIIKSLGVMVDGIVLHNS